MYSEKSERHHFVSKVSFETLLSQIEKLINHYEERVKWWKNKYEEVLEKIKSEGIKISASVAMGYSNVNKRDFDVNISDDLKEDLLECSSKIKEHSSSLEEAKYWKNYIQSFPNNAHFNLKFDDYKYFFKAGI